MGRDERRDGERERVSVGSVGDVHLDDDYGEKKPTPISSPWSVEFDDPRGRDVVVVRRVQEARVERGAGGRSVASVVVGRGLRLRVREDDVLDDVSTGTIDGGIGRRADTEAAAAAAATLVVVEVLRISHHPIDGLGQKRKWAVKKKTIPISGAGRGGGGAGRNNIIYDTLTK